MFPTPAPAPQQPTPPPVPPPDIQAYLDRQVASSKDKKFHLIANGKDLPLTPFHVWRQKEVGPNSTSTCVDMRSDEGRVYDIDFVTAGKDVTSVRVHRINGETVRCSEESARISGLNFAELGRKCLVPIGKEI